MSTNTLNELTSLVDEFVKLDELISNNDNAIESLTDRAQEIQAAKLLNSKVKHLRDEAVQKLALLVEKTYKEMLAYKEEYLSLDSSIALSQENYKLRSIAFKEGLSTSVELVDAQMFLMGAKTKRLNAAYNFVQKVSQLSVLSGDRELFFQIEELSEGIE